MSASDVVGIASPSAPYTLGDSEAHSWSQVFCGEFKGVVANEVRQQRSIDRLLVELREEAVRLRNSYLESKIKFFKERFDLLDRVLRVVDVVWYHAGYFITT